MSGRSTLRFALAGLLAVAFAASAVAQEGGFQVPLNSDPVIPIPLLPTAPMPREKDDGLTIEIESSFGVVNVKLSETPTGSFGAALSAAAPVMPQPVPPVIAPTDHRQLFNFYVGLFDSNEPVMPQPQAPRIVVPLLGSCPVPSCLTGGHGYKPSVAVSPLPCCPPVALPPIAPPGHVGNTKLLQVIALDVCPHGANPLLGTWYRDAGIGVVAVTFTHDEMKVCVSQREDGKLITMTGTAHYTLTKDGLVYGSITSADVDVKSDGKGVAAVGMELAELSMMLQELADVPFSFRTKMTSAGLMVSQLKVASVERVDLQDLRVFGGVYKSAKDGKVPAPTAPKGESSSKADRYTPAAPPVSTYTAPPSLLDVPLPPPPPGFGTVTRAAVGPDGLQRVGVDFNFSVPLVINPCDRGTGSVIGAASCPPSVPRPACNDAMKSMAADTFGQMLRGYGGMTLPSGRYLEHYPQYFAPDPAFPLPRELAGQEDPEGAARRAGGLPPVVQGTVPAGTPTGTYVVLPAGATPMPSRPVAPTAAPAFTSARASHMGTWFREIGSKQCVVKIEADHLTVTMSEAQELGDKKMTGHLTFTADYSLTRDGMTAVGLITNVDVKIDGDLTDDEMSGLMEKVREMQKALEEKPFAMTFRRYGETLVIGNVRMPEIGDAMESQPASYIGGRYSNATDKVLPKLKVTKACEPRPLPMPAYGPPLIPGPWGPGVYGPLPVPCPGPYGVPPGAFNGPALPPNYPGPASVAIPFGFPVGCPQAGLPAIPCPAPNLPIPASSDLLPPQTLPTPSAPRPVEFTMPAPTAPVPTMPEPIPPAASDKDEPVKPGKKQKKVKPSDPISRVQAVLDVSNALKLVREEAAPREPNHRQLFNFSSGVFGSQ